MEIRLFVLISEPAAEYRIGTPISDPSANTPSSRLNVPPKQSVSHPSGPSDLSIGKDQPIAKWVSQQQIQTTPRLFCEPRILFRHSRGISFGDKLVHELLDRVRVDLDGRPRTTVTAVL